MIRYFSVLLPLLVLSGTLHAEGLKVYISADMEGIAGVVNHDQLSPGSFEYEQFRGFMTAEVNAAIEGAREAGATEILVSDSHGNGLNLLLDKLPQNIQLVRSWPRPLGMMEGIDASFDAALFVGYHASAGNPVGIRAHTQSGSDFYSVKINGIEMSEGALNGLIAGHFGVPVVMVSGDDAAVKEVSELVGPMEGAVVKWQISHEAGRTLMPEAAQAVIREKAAAGVKRRADIKPYDIEGPLTLDLAFKNADAAEMIAYLPNVERIDNHTVRFVGDIVEINMFFEMVLGFPPTMNH
ncbi:MAG: M55 family metallopeptidase [Gammaproteobacteria bacterium]|nr:M55 family metallopeptidase [Gammaproteobacteria bacterium]